MPLLVGLIAVGAGVLVVAFSVGSSGYSWPELAAIFSGTAPDSAETVFFQIRLPRAIGAVLVGACLGVAGCGLQGVFQNPLADPFVLGISAGAGLGAALALAFANGGEWLTAGASFAFGLGTVLLVYRVARLGGHVSPFSLLLSGFVVSSLMSALLSFVMILNRDKMEQVVMWNMGSLSAMSWEKIAVLTPLAAVASAALMMYARALNVLTTGDETALSLGVDVERVRRRLLVFTSLAAAGAVAVSGIIGFVGLMIPHLLRLVQGPNNRTLLPLSALGGGIYLLLCDTVARTVVPGREIPVGVITSIFGVPFFIFLLRRSRARGI